MLFRAEDPIGDLFGRVEKHATGMLQKAPKDAKLPGKDGKDHVDPRWVKDWSSVASVKGWRIVGSANQAKCLRRLPGMDTVRIIVYIYVCSTASVTVWMSHPNTFHGSPEGGRGERERERL